MSKWWVAITVALGALSLSPGAAADAVMPPPDNCPPGSVGEASHNGPWCRPTTCTTDADCDKLRTYEQPAVPRVCREQPLCIESRTEPNRSGWRSREPITRQLALSTCSSGASCP